MNKNKIYVGFDLGKAGADQTCVTVLEIDSIGVSKMIFSQCFDHNQKINWFRIHLKVFWLRSKIWLCNLKGLYERRKL